MSGTPRDQAALTEALKAIGHVSIEGNQESCGNGYGNLLLPDDVAERTIRELRDAGGLLVLPHPATSWRIDIGASRDDAEVSAITMLLRLSEPSRRRVIRYLVSRDKEHREHV
jgi:hypothetical protein